MERLIQIIYVSKSSFTPTLNSFAIQPNIASILAKSRINNRKNGLVGVLYFGDGCFFQCLEGEEFKVNELYAKLKQDSRHKDLMLISTKLITSLSFTNWSMKYVPLEAKLNNELKANGYSSFDPYKFDVEMTTKVLKLLQSSSNVDNVENGEAVADNFSGLSAGKSKNYMVIFTLIFSVLALAISIFNIFHSYK